MSTAATGGPEGFDDFIASEQFEGGLAAAIDELDKSQQDLYGLLGLAKTDIAQIKDADGDIPVNCVPQNTAILKAFKLAIETGQNPDEKISLVSSIWMDDLRKRYLVTHPDDPEATATVLEVSKETLDKAVADMASEAGSDKLFLGDLMEYYVEDLYSDVKTFITAQLQASHQSDGHDSSVENTRLQAILEITRSLGGHTLDVAKLAAGIAAGLTISRLIDKRFFNK